MKQGFDKLAFETALTRGLKLLAHSERVTREQLRALSRTVLEAHHATEDIGYTNRLLEVLTPVNRKVAVAYFEHFGGFHYDTALARFTKKSKKRYAECVVLADKFLEDPMNNLWSWAERNIEVTKKEFELAQVTAAMGAYLKKATKAGMSQVDVLKAVLAAGITTDSIIAMLDTIEAPAEDVVSQVASHFGMDVTDTVEE
jgi:hypothetical protein